MNTIVVTDYNSGNKKEVQLSTRGLVIKIQDYKKDGRDYHNHWGVVLHMYENEEYRVAVKVTDYITDIIVIKEENIKTLIGDIDSDFCHIGAKRHASEVVPLILEMQNY